MTADKIESEGKKMKIHVYVNFCDQEVRSESEFNQMRDEMIEEDFQNTRIFNEWLDENYSSTELFELDPEDKKSVREDYHKYLEGYVKDQLDGDCWEEFTLEV